MELFSFVLVEDSITTGVELMHAPTLSVTDRMWETFALDATREKTLRPEPAHVLANRHRQRCAAIALKGDRIISYTSLVPIFSESIRSALPMETAANPASFPPIDMYGFSTGWTDPEWRKRGVNSRLRNLLLKGFEQDECLLVSVTAGIGASYILEKLGWRIVAWSEIPFASALIGVPVEGLEQWVGSGWYVPPDMPRYEGKHISPGQKGACEWDHLCFLWVSSIPLAKRLDLHLKELAQGTLRSWQKAVLKIFSQRPDSPWTIHLFRESI